MAANLWFMGAGNAPTLMSVADLKRLAPVWFNMSLAVHADPDAVREWGWVQVRAPAPTPVFLCTRAHAGSAGGSPFPRASRGGDTQAAG